jgi:hypothetical protein
MHKNIYPFAPNKKKARIADFFYLARPEITRQLLCLALRAAVADAPAFSRLRRLVELGPMTSSGIDARRPWRAPFGRASTRPILIPSKLSNPPDPIKMGTVPKGPSPFFYGAPGEIARPIPGARRFAASLRLSKFNSKLDLPVSLRTPGLAIHGKPAR